MKEEKMPRKFFGAVSVMSAFAALDSAQATPTIPSDVNEFLRPQSFAQLLEPVPNALALLKAVDEAQAAESRSKVKLAQYFYHHHHHHHTHHHHHSYWQNGWGPPVYNDGEGYGYSYGYGDYGGSSAHDRRMQIIWCTQHPGRC
jgi:ABC-type nickel/cobalt efflux system permease component RcnA